MLKFEGDSNLGYQNYCLQIVSSSLAVCTQERVLLMGQVAVTVSGGSMQDFRVRKIVAWAKGRRRTEGDYLFKNYC